MPSIRVRGSPRARADGRSGESAASDASAEPAESMLRTLAGETGGEAVLDPAQLGAGLQRVARDLDAYYLLTYTSSHAGDGRFYDVQSERNAAMPSFAHVQAIGRPSASNCGRSRNCDVEAHAGVASQSVDSDVARALPARRRAVRDLHVGAGGAVPGVKRAGEPAVIGLKVTTPAGAVLYEGELRAPGETIGSSLVLRRCRLSGVARAHSGGPGSSRAGRQPHGHRARTTSTCRMSRRPTRSFFLRRSSSRARRATSVNSARILKQRRFRGVNSAGLSACCSVFRSIHRPARPSRSRHVW